MALIAAALLVVAGATTGPPASAQSAEPVVTVTASNGTHTSGTDCKGTDFSEGEPAQITVSRSGDLSGDLSVDVDYQPASLAVGLPDPVVIPAGSDHVVVEVEQGALSVTVAAGAGYAVGAPSSAEVEVMQLVVDLMCNFGTPAVEQTITVGETPSAVDLTGGVAGSLDGTSFEQVGDAPPGLTYHRDGTWSGTATTVGTFEFTTYYCTDLCKHEVTVRIHVRPVVTERPPIAPPAPPAPATPIRSTPTLTG